MIGSTSINGAFTLAVNRATIERNLNPSLDPAPEALSDCAHHIGRHPPPCPPWRKAASPTHGARIALVNVD